MQHAHGKVYGLFKIYLRRHRITGQGVPARDFDTSKSLKNTGILNAYPVFILYDWGKRPSPRPAAPIARRCVEEK